MKYLLPTVTKPTENPGAFVTLGNSRPSTPLEDVAAAKADLDGAAAEYVHYRRRYVKTIRRALDSYTQAEIAATVGVNRSAISRLIRR